MRVNPRLEAACRRRLPPHRAGQPHRSGRVGGSGAERGRLLDDGPRTGHPGRFGSTREAVAIRITYRLSPHRQGAGRGFTDTAYIQQWP